MRFCYYIHILLVFCIVEVFSGWGANNPHLDFLDVAPAGWVRMDIYSPQQTNFIEFQKIGDPYTSAIQITIKFPKDGTQPTTADAALWSCANVDNDAVTEWYLRMFGWTAPEENEKKPLEMGFGVADATGKQGAVPIVRFNPSQNELKTGEAIMTAWQKALFWGTFRQIAKNPVGRVLLYRLLIEIRRINQKGEGCQGEDAVSSQDHLPLRSPQSKDEAIANRKYARSVNVIHVIKDAWSYTSGDATDNKNIAIICCYFLRSREPVTLVVEKDDHICTEYKHEENIGIYNQTSLFHEMLHWYQQLRFPVRDDIETGLSYYQICKKNSALLISNYYPLNLPMPYLSWFSSKNFIIPSDDLRVICGSAQDFDANYIEGDDLSENALRCSLNTYMRFGHGRKISAENIILAALENAYNVSSFCVKQIQNKATWEKYRAP